LNKQTFVHEAAIQSELSQWTLLLRRDGRRCCLAPIGWTLPSVSAAETLLHLGSSRRPALCYCAVVSGTGTGSDLAGKAAGGRKLIAVVYADMAGYSRLIALDDAGTLQRLRCLRRTLIEPAINEHGGTLVQTGGDSLLVAFDSIDGAVRFAVKVQRQVPTYDGEEPPERHIRFRIGVNIGDVIADGSDLHGDGVNVAARLQAECQAGHVCVSRAVRDHLGNRLGLRFEALGPLDLKNIAGPVEAFLLRVETTQHAISAPARLVPRLSIVVLPFTNLGNDPDQEYFADGITEDLTTDLSRIPGMVVISRNTAFTYRKKIVATKQIGHELSVRYLLEGSVRRLGNQIRVNAQLIDAETDSHVWAERFVGDIVDLFALQDEITSRIALAFGSELVIAEAARPTEHPDTLDYILRGRAALSKPPTRNNYADAIGLFERALAFDPGSVEAQSLLASTLARRVLDQMNASAASGAADIVRAEELVGQALAVSPGSPRAHFAKGDLLCAQRQFAEAIPEYESVLASNRNAVDAIAIIGRAKIYIGMIDEAIPLEEQAFRLSPRDPRIGVWYVWIAQAYLLQSHVDEAIVWLEKARSANPAISYVHLYLASAYALKGESEPAAAELAEARRLVSDDRNSTISRLKATGGYWGVPKVRALYDATVFAGLRKAGMPEE
jgi:adenylate cyclase